MNFDFSPEQKAFGAQIRRLLERQYSLAQARAALGGDVGMSHAIWRALGEAGFLGAAIDCEHGGVGLGPLEICVAAQELGRALAPTPSLASVYLCAEAIRLYGDTAQRAHWLALLASGAVTGAWASDDSFAPVLSELPVLDAGRLRGERPLVLNGLMGDVVVTLARTRGDETILALCPLNGSGIQRSAAPGIDPTRRAASLRFDNAPAQPLGHAGASAYLRLVERAAIFLAFEQIGAADRGLEMARDYALQRKSFGRPIGSYQAIKHKLADIYAGNQIARAHAYYGAWAVAVDAGELPLAAAGARVSACEALTASAQENIQTHGGIGVTWDSDCHLFYRRARFDALVLGGPLAWKSRALDILRASAGSE